MTRCRTGAEGRAQRPGAQRRTYPSRLPTGESRRGRCERRNVMKRRHLCQTQFALAVTNSAGTASPHAKGVRIRQERGEAHIGAGNGTRTRDPQLGRLTL